MPEPHEAEHEPHGPQLLQVQCTAHQWYISFVFKIIYEDYLSPGQGFVLHKDEEVDDPVQGAPP